MRTDHGHVQSSELLRGRHRPDPCDRRVPHTFAGFECVGDHASIGGDLVETGRYDNSFPLIPTSGMSGAPRQGHHQSSEGSRLNFPLIDYSHHPFASVVHPKRQEKQFVSLHCLDAYVCVATDHKHTNILSYHLSDLFFLLPLTCRI